MSKEETESKEKKVPAPIVPQTAKTIPLDYPIKFGEREISQLVLRPLTAKDMRRSSATMQTIMSQSTMLEYAGYLSGEPPHIIDKLEASDAIDVIMAVTGFFEASRKTGPK